jgi:hypothetical protein
MQSWIHVLEWRATAHPDLTALADDRGARYTYADLRTQFERRAGGWAALGIGPGDIVAIVAKNSADFLVQTFAVLRTGAAGAGAADGVPREFRLRPRARPADLRAGRRSAPGRRVAAYPEQFCPLVVVVPGGQAQAEALIGVVGDDELAGEFSAWRPVRFIVPTPAYLMGG